ncbi:MAG: hypothetical protein C0493_13735 [Kytococcus sp.]|nr:hypothetical protein [Kytococcus sp.]
MALSAGAGLVALGLVATLASQSVLAVGLTAAHEDTRLYLDELSATQVGVVGTTAQHAAGSDDPTGATRARLGLQLQDVRIHGLCLVATHDVPGVGTVSAVVTAGEPVDGTITREDPITFPRLALDVASLEGDGQDATGLELGQSADTVPGAGVPGEFGVAVDELHLSDLSLSSGVLDLSSARLPGMKVRTVGGAADRKDCTT